MFKVWCWVWFWLGSLFVAIDVLCAMIEFSIGQTSRGLECLLWAAVCAVCAGLNYTMAKGAR